MDGLARHSSRDTGHDDGHRTLAGCVPVVEGTANPGAAVGRRGQPTSEASFASDSSICSSETIGKRFFSSSSGSVTSVQS